MKNLNKMKKVELEAMASERNISIQSGATKNDIIALLLKTDEKEEKEGNDIMKKGSKVMNKRAQVFMFDHIAENTYVCHMILNNGELGNEVNIPSKLFDDGAFKFVNDKQIEAYRNNLAAERDARRREHLDTSNVHVRNTFVDEEAGKHRFVLSVSKGGSLVIIDNETHEVREVGVSEKFTEAFSSFFKPVADNVKDFKYNDMDSVVEKFAYKYFSNTKDETK